MKSKYNLSFNKSIFIFLIFCIGCKNNTTQNTENQAIVIEDTRAKLDSAQYNFTPNGIDLTWKMLGITKYEKEFSQQLGGMVDIPTFPKMLEDLNDYQVFVKGYIIPLEEVGNDTLLILSKNPYTSCFFCGQAGPETVMEIRLKNQKKFDFKLDQKVTFKGAFKTNGRDFDYLNFILNEAKVLEK
jgi:hypothetical protein